LLHSLLFHFFVFSVIHGYHFLKPKTFVKNGEHIFWTYNFFFHSCERNRGIYFSKHTHFFKNMTIFWKLTKVYFFRARTNILDIHFILCEHLFKMNIS
jgi:hypothetical protein